MKNPRYVLVRRRTTGEKTRDVLEVQDLLKDVVIKRISLVSIIWIYVNWYIKMFQSNGMKNE